MLCLVNEFFIVIVYLFVFGFFIVRFVLRVLMFVLMKDDGIGWIGKNMYVSLILV